MKETVSQVKVSIRTKLFLLVLVAFTLLIVITAWQLSIQSDNIARDSVKQSLKESSTILDTKLESRVSNIREIANGLSRDGRVFPLVYEQESLTLQDLTQEFKQALDFHMLFFTNADGEVIARSDRPEAIGLSMAGKTKLFDLPLNGESSSGVIVSRGKLLQVVVIPIFDNVETDLVKGSVALAYEFSQEMAEEINSLTASEIGFMVFSRDKTRQINGVKTTYLTDSTLAQYIDTHFSENPESWKTIADSNEKIIEMEFIFDGEEYLSLIHRLANDSGRPLGFVITLRSRSDLLKPFIQLQQTVFLIGFICLVIASIFAWVFAQRISSPVVNLVKMTKDIQEGHYPHSDQLKKSTDEIGLLHNSVINMGQTLKHKAELENYLAVMADELERDQVAVYEFDENDPNKTLIDGHTDFANKQAVHLKETDATEQLNLSSPTLGSDLSTKEGTLHIHSIIDLRYKVLAYLGSGAMGQVYLARDVELEEQIAIKILPKNIIDNQNFINFKEEIRLARKITHRNILRTFDFGQWQEYYYITMEYLPGYDLGQLLRTKGAFNPQIGVILAQQICSAMHAAHEQGIIHRDLKPSNMMINRQGILKIMDFGLATSVQTHSGKRSSKTKSSSTVAGTPKYMAPEQFFSMDLDERSDIYSIGIILYAIFSGKPPFNESAFEVLATKHQSETPKPIRIDSGRLDSQLQNVIFKAIAKSPEDRYQTVREMMDDLNGLSTI